MPSDSPFVFTTPTYYDRRRLMPLPGTPWLQCRPFPPAVWPVLISVAVLLLLRLQAAPLVAAVLLLPLLLVMATLGVIAGRERHIQICPACTSGMSRGSTRCPQCRFEGR